MATERSGFLRGLAEGANPAFAVLAPTLPVLALAGALASGSVTALNYVHVLTGAAWTGIDIYLGFVLGPTLAGLGAAERAAVFRRLTPKMTFLMPALAAVTITAGVLLAGRLALPLSNPWILAAYALATAMTVNGFGVILPGQVRIYREFRSGDPDVERVAALGSRNARLGGLQGVMQVLIVFVMANLAF